MSSANFANVNNNGNCNYNNASNANGVRPDFGSIRIMPQEIGVILLAKGKAVLAAMLNTSTFLVEQLCACLLYADGYV